MSRAGVVRINGTRIAALGLSRKAVCIEGRDGAMVAPAIIVIVPVARRTTFRLNPFDSGLCLGIIPSRCSINRYLQFVRGLGSFGLVQKRYRLIAGPFSDGEREYKTGLIEITQAFIFLLAEVDCVLHRKVF